MAQKYIRVGKDWATVDAEDYDRLSKRTWYKNNKGYAQCFEKNGEGVWKGKLMHRMIMGAEKGFDVHHVSHNPLDNRKDNLCICTHKENLQNLQKPQSRNGKEPTSQYKGVFRHQNGKYKVTIRHEGKQYHLGYHENEIDAAKTYDAAAKYYHGSFAVLNFP